MVRAEAGIELRDLFAQAGSRATPWAEAQRVPALPRLGVGEREDLGHGERLDVEAHNTWRTANSQRAKYRSSEVGDVMN